MARAKFYLKKGDGATRYCWIPTASWTAGGKLFFAAKEKPDNDSADALAVINKTFTDSVVSDDTIDGVAYKKYTMVFTAADTNGISFADGKKRKKYLGEFQYVAPGQDPVTFPAEESADFIDVIIAADIKRGTT